MKVTIIYDNTAYREELQDDWGFSALVEKQGKKLLFDTGGSGSILLSNMEKLGIEPKEIEEVFISHAHFDHIGGLSDFLDLNSNVRVWIPQSFRGLKNAREIIRVEKTRKVSEGIYTTGELEGIEQALCVETERGIVIVAGCMHTSIEMITNIASQYGKVYGIIGGLHDNKPETLVNFSLICACHCTHYREEIKSLFPGRHIEGGVGKIIEIGD